MTMGFDCQAPKRRHSITGNVKNGEEYIWVHIARNGHAGLGGLVARGATRHA